MTTSTEKVAPLEHVVQYLCLAQEYGASDLHLTVNTPPHWRLNGHIQPIWDNAEELSAETMERYVKELLGEREWERLETTGDVDFAYAIDEGRFRASCVKQRMGLELVFRVINTTVRSIDELNLPQSLKLLTQYHNGLVLVTGAVGSGKSTTLAAILNEINESRYDHIITLEDPIEYVFNSKRCHITQREVHLHTQSFSNALRAALREDPDIIMVGEMRDLETISLAITASETGHLVLGTLHTGNAARTLDRVLDVFPIKQRDQIRTMVSESLRGIISQQLVPKADGSGRALAMELLVNTPAVANCIREGKTFMLPGIMQTGKKVGMSLMDDALLGLYQKGDITKEEALGRANDRVIMRQNLGIS